MTATTTVDISASPEPEPEPAVEGSVQRQALLRQWLPWLVFATSLGLFVYGERSIPLAGPSQFGLLAVASPAYGASIILAAVGFAIAIRRDSMAAGIVATLLTIIVLRLPSAVATDMPMYAWTYKHIGVADYIQHAHTLARDVDIYNGWPGLFALTAWFSELTGLSPFTIAHWFTPIYHVVVAALAYGAARSWRLNPLTALISTYFVVALNWVGQDYYSPQAVTLIFVIAIIGLLGLAVRTNKPLMVVPLLVMFAAAVITHQLTPYWLMLVVGLLACTGKIRPAWIVVPMAIMLIGFLIYNWQQASAYSLFSSDVAQNIKSNVPVKGVMGQRITGGGMRVLSSAIWIGTALVQLYRYRKHQEFWALGVVALSPLLLVLVQSYGGEVIFRVYLYSLMGCSIVWAPLLRKMLQGSTKQYSTAFTLIVLGTIISAQGAMGSWYANVMPKIQVETSRIVLAQAELPAYLTSVAPVWPERSSWRYVDYARFHKYFDQLMIEVPTLAGRHFDNDEDYEEFIKALYGRPDGSTYLVMTDQMRVYAWYFGILPWDALPNLKERLKKDTRRWEPFYDRQGFTVFLHRVDTKALTESPGPTQ